MVSERHKDPPQPWGHTSDDLRGRCRRLKRRSSNDRVAVKPDNPLLLRPRLSGLAQPVVTPLAQALQGASSERVDVAAMGLDVVRYRGRLDLAGSKAQLAQRLAPQLMSTPLPILAVAIPVVWIAVAEVCCH